MTDEVPQKLKRLAGAILQFDEGFERSPYLDSKNFWTIGIGHLIGRDLKELRLSDPIILQLFHEDFQIHWHEASILFGEEFLLELEPARQVAIVSLVYTLGREKLSRFFETLPALREKKWQRAAELLLQTKWARDVDPRQIQDKGRDDRIAFMISTGEVHADYQIDSALLSD